MKNTCLPIVIVLLTFSSVTFAAIPRTIAYQGILTDSAGNPRADGRNAISFSFYESESGGSAVWSQRDSLYVRQGMFSTFLGNSTPFGGDLKFEKPYWLGISVNGGSELKPRVPITSVGYCFYALRADTAEVAKRVEGGTTIDSNSIMDGAVSGADISRDANLTIGDLMTNGNVGLGMSPSNVRLAVSGNTPVSLKKGTGFLQVGADFSDENVNVAFDYESIQSRIANGTPRSLLLNPLGGNVGIGMKNPAAVLHIAGDYSSVFNCGELIVEGLSSHALIDLHTSGGTGMEQGIRFYHNGVNQAEMYSVNGDRTLRFWMDGHDRMVIDSNGCVGIGTTTPTSRLHVSGLPEYTDNSDARDHGGLTPGAFYRTGDVLKVVH